MTQITLYHNPRCTKSRAALALLEERGLNPELRLYLEQPPTVEELQQLLQLLQLEARDLLRSNEALSKERSLDDPAVPAITLLQAMCEHPRLLQRPIAVSDQRAVLGRPPERVLELLP